MKYKIITGANDYYILTLINFINYHLKMGIILENMIIYDLGLNDTNLQKLKNILNDKIYIKKLNYDEYPEHVNLNIYNGLFCSYAFKPIIIYNEANINNNIPIIWLDCACKINLDILNKIINSINLNGFYCPIGNYEKTIETIELNHPQTVNLLGITREQHINELQTRLACICGVKYNNFNGNQILNNWYTYSLDKNIIMPEGSSRNNHRQDQTVLSCIMFLYEKKNNIIFEKSTFNTSCWNKCDRSIVASTLNEFCLFKKSNNQILACIYEKTLDEAIKIYAERKLISIDTFNTHFYVLQKD